MKKSSASQKKSGLSFQQHALLWSSKIVFTAILLLVAYATVMITKAILPIVPYIILALIGYVVLVRHEFKEFRKTFQAESSLTLIAQSFLCCLCAFKKNLCPSCSKSKQCSCFLKNCCCWTSCFTPESEVKMTSDSQNSGTSDKKPPAKKKAPPKKTPAKKESSS